MCEFELTACEWVMHWAAVMAVVVVVVVGCVWYLCYTIEHCNYFSVVLEVFGFTFNDFLYFGIVRARCVICKWKRFILVFHSASSAQLCSRSFSWGFGVGVRRRERDYDLQCCPKRVSERARTVLMFRDALICCFMTGSVRLSCLPFCELYQKPKYVTWITG